jgi:hypothetical protein
MSNEPPKPLPACPDPETLLRMAQQESLFAGITKSQILRAWNAGILFAVISLAMREGAMPAMMKKSKDEKAT